MKEFNIRLLTVTDAEFKVDKQVSDIESIIQIKPNLLIGFCVDRQGNAAVYRKAKNAGIKISFMDTMPIDFKYPADYAGLTLADNYEAGVVAAELVADAIGGKGEVAVMWFPISMFHVDQRYYGIVAKLKEYDFDYSAMPWREIDAFLSDLKAMPTEYFEAKPRRVVQLQEFSGAIIPKTAGQNTRDT